MFRDIKSKLAEAAINMEKWQDLAVLCAPSIRQGSGLKIEIPATMPFASAVSTAERVLADMGISSQKALFGLTIAPTHPGWESTRRARRAMARKAAQPTQDGAGHFAVADDAHPQHHGSGE